MTALVSCDWQCNPTDPSLNSRCMYTSACAHTVHTNTHTHWTIYKSELHLQAGATTLCRSHLIISSFMGSWHLITLLTPAHKHWKSISVDLGAPNILASRSYLHIFVFSYSKQQYIRYITKSIHQLWESWRIPTWIRQYNCKKEREFLIIIRWPSAVTVHIHIGYRAVNAPCVRV